MKEGRTLGSMSSFAVIVLLVGLGQVVAYVLLMAANVPVELGLLGTATSAVALAVVGTVVFERLTLPLRRAAESGLTSQAQLAAHQATALERRRKLRHDLRGILSPALLTADRLLTSTDPASKRAGEMMVKAVERASELLQDQAD